MLVGGRVGVLCLFAGCDPRGPGQINQMHKLSQQLCGVSRPRCTVGETSVDWLGGVGGRCRAAIEL